MNFWEAATAVGHEVRLVFASSQEPSWIRQLTVQPWYRDALIEWNNEPVRTARYTFSGGERRSIVIGSSPALSGSFLREVSASIEERPCDVLFVSGYCLAHEDGLRDDVRLFVSAAAQRCRIIVDLVPHGFCSRFGEAATWEAIRLADFLLTSEDSVAALWGLDLKDPRLPLKVRERLENHVAFGAVHLAEGGFTHYWWGPQANWGQWDPAVGIDQHQIGLGDRALMALLEETGFFR